MFIGFTGIVPELSQRCPRVYLKLSLNCLSCPKVVQMLSLLSLRWTHCHKSMPEYPQSCLKTKQVAPIMILLRCWGNGAVALEGPMTSDSTKGNSVPALVGSVCCPTSFSFKVNSRPDWILFWAAAPKGRCPVGHRGDFPDVRTSVRPPPRSILSLKFPLNNMEN